MTGEESPSQTCDRCGEPLPTGLLAGQCPRCLIETSFDGHASDQSPDHGASAERFPRLFGDFELLAELGRGGMGVVYRARQLSLNRDVALKILPGGEFARPEFRKRFRAEALTAARLQHPNIVAIYEVGEHEGLPFFAMELVCGRTLAEIIRDGALSPDKAAEYCLSLSRAVHFAHSKGVLHRDLKPPNILLDAFDQPRLTDFGLARSLGANSDLTLSGQTVGSPAYMPPEQALGKSETLGPAADVYSLGAILYHLIAGRPPFQGSTLPQVLRQVQEDEPIPPKRLNPGIPEDLQTIGLKCLQKDPAQRYHSAQDLADDLQRFLRSEAIQARPLSRTGRVWLWCRRRPAVAALSASVLLLLVIVAFGSSAAAWRVSRARGAERMERKRAESANTGLQVANTRLAATIDLLELQRAEDFFRANESAAGVAHFSAILRRDPSNSIAASRLVSALVHRHWVLPVARPIRHEENLQMVVFSPDHRQVLSVSGEDHASVLQCPHGELLFRLTHHRRVLMGNYSSDGHLIITADAGGAARLWNATNGQPLAAPLRHDAEVLWAEFNHDGRQLVTVGGQTAKLWDTATGGLRHSLTNHDLKLRWAHFSPDGERVATVTEDGAIRLWDSRSGSFLFEFAGHRSRVNALAFSPSGRRIAAAGSQGTAWVWNLSDPPGPGIALVHSAEIFPIWHVAFSPDDQFVLSTSEDTTARVWNATNGFPVGRPLLHEGGVVFGDFTPDGQTIVTTSTDTSARIWNWNFGISLVQPLRHRKPVRYAAFSSGGARLATVSSDSTTRFWDLTARAALPIEVRHDQPVTSITFNPRANVLLTTSFDKTARLWNAVNGQPLGEPIRHQAAVLCGDFSPDGARVVTGCEDGSAQVHDCAAGRITGGPVRHHRPIRSVRFSHDSKRFITASADATARIWDAQSGLARTAPLSHQDGILSASFSPDDRFVVTISEDQTARVWDSQTGEAVTEPLRHRDHVKWADFSPDSRKVVTASKDDTACIWDISTSRPLVPLLQHARIVERALFSPDGQRVVTVSQDRTARIWDAATGQALTPPLQHETAVSHLSYSPDGRRILTGGWNGLVRVWDATTGQPLTEWLYAGGKLAALSFDSTGERIATGADGGFARVWALPLAQAPVPGWFLDFAEAVAGMRLNPLGTVELLSRAELDSVVSQIGERNSADFYVRVVRWFLADPAHRSPSPF